MARYLIESGTTTFGGYDAVDADHALNQFAEDSNEFREDLSPDVVAIEIDEPTAYGYAVIKTGHALFGVGRTEAAAKADAEEWVDTDESGEPDMSGLDIVRCSEDLLDLVRRDGSADVWGEVHGVICTLRQESAWKDA